LNKKDGRLRVKVQLKLENKANNDVDIYPVIVLKDEDGVQVINGWYQMELGDSEKSKFDTFIKGEVGSVMDFVFINEFSAEYFEKLSDVKMPASKLELLVKMLRKQIKEYGKTNQVAAKKFQEMLEETIKQYHERRKHLTAEEAGAAQEHTTEEIIKNATEQALQILKAMNVDRESFRKIGLTFEEKAFYDILMALRDEYNFVYGEDKTVDGVTVNEKCKNLAKKVKEIIDTKSSFADWLNNQIVRDQLKFDIKVCLIKNGYPPQYSPEVFRKVMEQVENFEENN
jgi:type I restriction enzyme R subunit